MERRSMGGIMRAVKFGARGLVPAIVQNGVRGRVLMLAYMDRTALKRTLETGLAHFFSRSRRRIWKKGEESGHTQRLRELRIDCYGNSLLLIVRQKGPGACHTGYRSCYFRKAGRGRWRVTERRTFDPARAYGRR